MAFFFVKVSFEARTLNFPCLFLSHELLWPAGPFVIISFQVQQGSLSGVWEHHHLIINNYQTCLLRLYWFLGNLQNIIKIQRFLVVYKIEFFHWFRTLFENYSKCRIRFLTFWHFPPIFVLLKLTCLVTLFDHKLQVFKNSPKWTIFGIFN